MYTPPAIPISGTPITVAFYRTNIADNISHIHRRTGGDPLGSGLALISSGSTTGEWQQIPTAAYADQSITTAKYADSSVTGAKIAGNAINGTHIQFGSIGTNHLLAASIPATKFQLPFTNLISFSGNAIGVYLWQGGQIWDTISPTRTLIVGAGNRVDFVGTGGYIPIYAQELRATWGTVLGDQPVTALTFLEVVGGRFYVYQAGTSKTVEIFRVSNDEDAPIFKGQIVWHSGNFNAGAAWTSANFNPATKSDTSHTHAGGSSIPVGLVAYWNASSASIPSGWSELTAARDRFIIGANAGYAYNATGGSTQHQHTINNQHNHNMNHSHPDGTTSQFVESTTQPIRSNGDTNLTHDHRHTYSIPSVVQNTGDGGAVDSVTSLSSVLLPPYLALTVIVKT